MQGIEQLVKKGFSLIPLAVNTKIPIKGFRWKGYQYRRPTVEEVLNWYTNYGDINIGVICGKISKLVVIDVDNERQLLELLKVIPNLFDTCYVKTKRGYHFYFWTNGDDIKSTSRLFGLDGIELKAKGRYVVSANSIVDGFKYKYGKTLTHTNEIPKVIVGEYKGVKVLTEEITRDITPKVRAKCVGQILNYDLPVGQRKKAYHIAYSKMRQEGHLKGYAISLCRLANSKISLPLKNNEFDFGKIYYYGCPKINEELGFVDCSNCQVRGGKDVQSLLMRNIHKLHTLTTSERSILSILDSYFRGLEPTAYEVSKFIKNSNQHTIKMAIDSLKEKEII